MEILRRFRNKAILAGFLMIVAVYSCGRDFAGIDDDGEEFEIPDNNSMRAIMRANLKSLDSLMLSGDPDFEFLLIMKVHDLGAIKLANRELENGYDLSLRETAKKLISDNTKEIAVLDSFLLASKPVENDFNFVQGIEMAVMKMNLSTSLQVLDGTTDHDFAALMILHQQFAIDLADLEIRYGKVEEIKNLAGEMKKKQSKEIQDLQLWLGW